MSAHIKALIAYITKLYRQHRQRRADVAQRRLYISQIVEKVVDDIDPRLRSITGYQKVLSPCIERIFSYAEKVCSDMPGPMEFSRETHSTNSTVRTLFANHRKMAEVFSQCQEVQEFFVENPSADCTYLVLGMKMTEKTTLGMQQQGELIVKDVLQTSVNFDDYRITHSSLDEASLRFNLQERALHECVAQTIKKLLTTKATNNKLEEDEIKFRMQLSMLKNQGQGLGPLMQDDDTLSQRIHDIETKLQKIEHRQGEISKDVGTLNAFFKTAASILRQPESLLDVTLVSFCVDRFNHILTDVKENDQHRVKLAQITFSGNEKRVGVLAIFPKKELITKKSRPVYL